MARGIRAAVDSELFEALIADTTPTAKAWLFGLSEKLQQKMSL